jgi:hypothetical protein
MKKMNMNKSVRTIMGFEGAMISGSKSGYCNNNPDNLPVFNSNVIAILDGMPQKIWFGDVDVTKSITKLEELAKYLETDIYVLREMDARFENEDKPVLNRFVIKVSPDGERTLGKMESESWDKETLLRC